MSLWTRLVGILPAMSSWQGNEPHGHRVQPGNGTPNRLRPPALRVVNVARLPEDKGSHHSRPGKLSEDGPPPLPAAAHRRLARQVRPGTEEENARIANAC